MKKYLFLGLTSVLIGCSPPIPEYSVVNRQVSDTKSKTFVELSVIAKKSNITTKEIENLLSHLYDSIMSTKDYKYRSNPNACNIFVYPSREHFESHMGQWIGNISKPKNDKSPTIKTQFLESLDKKEVPNDKGILSDISIKDQIKIWNNTILSEDKSNIEAEKKYPIKITATSISDINKQRERAKGNSDKHYEYQETLLRDYKMEIIQENNITEEILKAITLRGLKENWPFPN